ENLTLAGLTNEEALVSTTRLSASWLGIEDLIGTVEESKFADLILLDSNPLENIRNTREISGVFVNGKWIDKKEINQMMMKVKKWNEDNKDNYKWKDRKKF
ncbi:MAG: amidohydrolase family protein, partial [Candidatus Kapaibacterium sp.]